METIIIEFEKVTKYPLISFLEKYRDFMTNSYTEIYNYFSGNVTSIDNVHFETLNFLIKECDKINSIFENFSNKFSNCGYWELMEMIENLHSVLQKISKFPKFLKTAKTSRGYAPFIQIPANVGSFRTMEDIANSVKQINQDNSDWIQIMLNNDLNEYDWEIDKLSEIIVFINNKTDIVVDTILEQPIGDKIYGKDISRKISFSDEDLEIKKYKENIEQKCDILLSINKGQVPENMLFGKSADLISGSTAYKLSYPLLLRDLQDTFLQNSLFEYINIIDFKFSNGDLNVKCEIKTKYNYKTEKNITI